MHTKENWFLFFCLVVYINLPHHNKFFYCHPHYAWTILIPTLNLCIITNCRKDNNYPNYPSPPRPCQTISAHINTVPKPTMQNWNSCYPTKVLVQKRKMADVMHHAFVIDNQLTHTDARVQLLLASKQVISDKRQQFIPEVSTSKSTQQRHANQASLLHWHLQATDDCSVSLALQRRTSKRNLLLLQLLHPFNGLFSTATSISRYRKGKTSLDLNETRDDGVLGGQWHKLDYMQIICTSLQTDNHTNSSSFNFYRPDALPDAQSTVSLTD